MGCVVPRGSELPITGDMQAEARDRGMNVGRHKAMGHAVMLRHWIGALLVGNRPVNQMNYSKEKFVGFSSFYGGEGQFTEMLGSLYTGAQLINGRARIQT